MSIFRSLSFMRQASNTAMPVVIYPLKCTELQKMAHLALCSQSTAKNIPQKQKSSAFSERDTILAVLQLTCNRVAGPFVTSLKADF